MGRVPNNVKPSKDWTREYLKRFAKDGLVELLMRMATVVASYETTISDLEKEVSWHKDQFDEWSKEKVRLNERLEARQEIIDQLQKRNDNLQAEAKETACWLLRLDAIIAGGPGHWVRK